MANAQNTNWDTMPTALLLLTSQFLSASWACFTLRTVCTRWRKLHPMPYTLTLRHAASGTATAQNQLTEVVSACSFTQLHVLEYQLPVPFSVPDVEHALQSLASCCGSLVLPCLSRLVLDFNVFPVQLHSPILKLPTSFLRWIMSRALVPNLRCLVVSTQILSLHVEDDAQSCQECCQGEDVAREQLDITLHNVILCSNLLRLLQCASSLNLTASSFATREGYADSVTWTSWLQTAFASAVKLKSVAFTCYQPDLWDTLACLPDHLNELTVLRPKTHLVFPKLEVPFSDIVNTCFRRLRKLCYMGNRGDVLGFFLPQSLVDLSLSVFRDPDETWEAIGELPNLQRLHVDELSISGGNKVDFSHQLLGRLRNIAGLRCFRCLSLNFPLMYVARLVNRLNDLVCDSYAGAGLVLWGTWPDLDEFRWGENRPVLELDCASQKAHSVTAAIFETTTATLDLVVIGNIETYRGRKARRLRECPSRHY